MHTRQTIAAGGGAPAEDEALRHVVGVGQPLQQPLLEALGAFTEALGAAGAWADGVVSVDVVCVHLFASGRSAAAAAGCG